MVGCLAALARTGPLPAVARGHVGFHAQDGLQVVGLGLLLKVPGAVHAAMVRQGQCRHLELFGFPDQVGQPVRSVEERVLRMGVQMDEGHVVVRSGSAHPTLPSTWAGGGGRRFQGPPMYTRHQPRRPGLRGPTNPRFRNPAA